MLNQEIAKVEEIVRKQNEWRLRTLNLIASENVMSERARRLLNSDFTHRYAEGHPGARYYQGTGYIDEIEAETREVFKKIFGCKRADVRPVSGTVSNEAVFGSIVKADDLALVTDVKSGAHISHQKFGALGKFTKNIKSFPLEENGIRLDVQKTQQMILEERPRIVILGKSVILFPEPVREISQACREAGAFLMYDGAHVLGLIAGKAFQDPLAEGADVMTASTHKTFFGSQRGVVLSNADDDVWKKIDHAVFPGCVSNHHLNTLPALLVSAHEFMTFGQEYARQVVANAKHLAKSLAAAGFDVLGKDWGYTASHQAVMDVSRFGGGLAASELLLKNEIVVNQNLVPFDKGGPKKPSGVRLGTQEMTRFGMKEPEMENIAALFKDCIIDGKNVAAEVSKFRSRFQKIHYSFDENGA